MACAERCRLAGQNNHYCRPAKPKAGCGVAAKAEVRAGKSDVPAGLCAAASLRRPATHACVWGGLMAPRDAGTSPPDESSAPFVRQTLVAAPDHTRGRVSPLPNSALRSDSKDVHRPRGVISAPEGATARQCINALSQWRRVDGDERNPSLRLPFATASRVCKPRQQSQASAGGRWGVDDI